MRTRYARGKTILVSCWLISIATNRSLADDPKRTHVITADDYFTQGQITDLVMSPDEKQAAYVELRWEPPEETRNADIWVVDVKSHDAIRLTFDRAADGAPKWSPDGDWIYFTSSPKRAGEDKPPYDGKTQVWRIRASGGEPQPVTRVKDGIGHYDLAFDGNSIYYTTSDEDVSDEWAALRKEFKDLQYGHGRHEFTKVHRLDLQNWRSEKIIDEKRVVGDMAVAPDGKRVAMITTPTESLITNEGWSRVDVWNADVKAVTSLPDKLWRGDAPSPYGWIESLCWDSTGRKLAFRVSFDGYPPMVFVAEFTREGPEVHRLMPPEGVMFATLPMQWRGKNNDLCFICEDHARARVYCTQQVQGRKQGPSRCLTEGDVVCERLSFGRNGRVMAFVMGDATHSGDVFVTRFDNPPTEFDRLTKINPQVDAWQLPQIQIYKWKGANGADVEGILELPPGKSDKERLPLIVELHGGPTAAAMNAMQFWIYGRTLYPALGYALFSPNYRGSTGYGDKFMTDLIGHENEVEIEDIITGVDSLIAKGVVDPARMGVVGWSNGGYLTNCIITHTNRFKAASSGAGIADMAMQWGTEDTPGHVINFMKGFPWTAADAMRKASPLFSLDKVKTPTLFHVGGDDSRCPPVHQRAMYRALHQYLNVPAELVVYPGEPHGLTKYTDRKAKMKWDQAWFDRYILGQKTDETPPKP